MEDKEIVLSRYGMFICVINNKQIDKIILKKRLFLADSKNSKLHSFVSKNKYSISPRENISVHIACNMQGPEFEP
jgi:hypothetical protein